MRILTQFLLRLPFIEWLATFRLDAFVLQLSSHFFLSRAADSTRWKLHPSHLSLTLLLLLDFTRFMRLISDNLAVTRHCTQPLLIFNDIPEPPNGAFCAFKGRIFQWHFCTATSQTSREALFVHLLHKFLMGEGRKRHQGINACEMTHRPLLNIIWLL